MHLFEVNATCLMSLIRILGRITLDTVQNSAKLWINSSVVNFEKLHEARFLNMSPSSAIAWRQHAPRAATQQGPSTKRRKTELHVKFERLIETDQ